jgi:hypothetical protein
MPAGVVLALVRKMRMKLGGGWWLAAALSAALVGCGGARQKDTPGPVDGPLSVPSGAWSDAATAPAVAGITVLVPDATGAWGPAADGTPVAIVDAAAPSVVLVSGTTLNGRWTPPTSAPAPAAHLLAMATVTDSTGASVSLRSLYAQSATELSPGSEALVAWLLPQLGASAPNLSDTEAAQLQELAEIEAQATLHRQPRVADAVAVASDVLLNLSRLPVFAAAALADGSEAANDADWLDLLANRDGDHLGITMRLGPNLAGVGTGDPATCTEAVSLSNIQRDANGQRLLAADAATAVHVQSVPAFMQRRGSALYWHDSALCSLDNSRKNAKVEAMLFQLADAVPVMAYPLRAQGPLWQQALSVPDLGVDLDGDAKNESASGTGFVEVVGIEEHSQGAKKMRALHLRRNVVLDIALTGTAGTHMAAGLRIDAWHVPGIGLIDETRQLGVANGLVDGQVQTAASADDVLTGESNGFDISIAQRSLAYGPVAQSLVADPRGDRALAWFTPAAGGTALVGVSLPLLQTYTDTQKLPAVYAVPTGTTMTLATAGLDGHSLYLGLSSADHAALLQRFDVGAAKAVATTALPPQNVYDPVSGVLSSGVPALPVAVAPDPADAAAALIVVGTTQFLYDSAIGKAAATDGAMTSLLTGSLGRSGVLADPLGSPVQRDTYFPPNARVSADGHWLYFDGATYGSGSRQQRVFRWALDGSAFDIAPFLADWRLVSAVEAGVVVQHLASDKPDRLVALVDAVSGDVLRSLDLVTVAPDLYGDLRCASYPWAPLFCHAPSTAGGRRGLWLDPSSLQVVRSVAVHGPVDLQADMVPLGDGSVVILDPAGFGGTTANRTAVWRADPRLDPGN